MEFREILSRLARAGPFIILGTATVWRAYSFEDPLDPSIIAPIFCILLGLLLMTTGLVLALRGGEIEPQPDYAEPPPQPN